MKSCISGVFLFFLPLNLLAVPASPTQTHDLNPLIIIYGLPLATPARLNKPGSQDISLSLNFSNTLNEEQRGNETLVMDGETHQYNLVYQYQLNNNWLLRARLSKVRHTAGNLDTFIDQFHHLFGLPEGFRPDYPKDELLFWYQVDGVDRIRVEQADEGTGDSNLEMAYQLSADIDTASSLWLSLKLPTGKAANLSGSEATDFAAWWAYESHIRHDWLEYYNVGWLFLGQGKVLADQQRRHVIFGTAGIQWNIDPAVSLNTQLDFHSGFFSDTDVTYLGDSIQISMGGQLRFDSRSMLDITVVEDIWIGASPDVTFLFSYRYRTD